MTDPDNWSWQPGSTLILSGEFEIAGKDYWYSLQGFSDNFNLDNLTISGIAYLEDRYDNQRYFREALYVNSLNVPVGSTLELRGVLLFTFLDGKIHCVEEGEGNLFGGGIIYVTPLPATIYLMAPVLLALLGLRRRS